MRVLEQATSGKRPWWLTLLGLVLVPVLVAAGLLAATWGSTDRLHKVEAAVVNLDKAVTIEGQIVPLGRQMSAALVDSNRDQNFTWVLADAKHAEAGLRSGRYAAVVTIPRTSRRRPPRSGRRTARSRRRSTYGPRPSRASPTPRSGSRWLRPRRRR